ncbi:hypothetical protein HOY80DRAFT_297377 [Tuber brumale]|nr:hypothetical protein HOY80DRAFT_297377 [Tuber brumale]
MKETFNGLRLISTLITATTLPTFFFFFFTLYHYFTLSFSFPSFLSFTSLYFSFTIIYVYTCFYFRLVKTEQVEYFFGGICLRLFFVYLRANQVIV